MRKLIRLQLMVTLTIIGFVNLRFAGAESGSAGPGLRPFAIEFQKEKVAFSGAIDSKKTADLLASSVISARPDLSVVNSGLAFNPSVNLPNLKLLKSLIVEIALSTHEGVLEISDDILVVGGLTDSVVTASVLRLRADPILEGRRYRDQMCLIPSGDLPEIPVLLSTGESRKGFSFDLELKEQEVVNYEPPGIILTKILRLIEGTGDSSKLFSALSAVPKPEMTENEPPAVEVDLDRREPDVEAPVLPPPPSPYEEFGPIRFASNSFLLQSGQREVIKQVRSLMQSEPWAGRQIVVRSLIYQSGSEAFSTWLSERRMNEAVRQLTVAGIEAGRLKPENVATLERIDKGEVKILVLKPDGYASPIPAQENVSRQE